MIIFRAHYINDKEYPMYSNEKIDKLRVMDFSVHASFGWAENNPLRLRKYSYVIKWDMNEF